MTAERAGPAPEPRRDVPDESLTLPSPPRVIREIEHKFRVHGLFEFPELATLDSVGGIEDHGTDDVESTYFDTADLRLIREGLALRRRAGGDDEGWHLKLPVDGEDSSVHDELRVTLGESGVPPASLTWLVDPIVRDTPIGEVARLRGRRHRQVIRDVGGVDVALLVDDTIEVLDLDGEVTARFREIELDPIASAERTGAVMHDVSTALSEAGGLGGDFVAKVVRALGPRATAPPEVPVVTLPADAGDTDIGTPEAEATVADAIAVTLSRTVRRLRATDLMLRRDPESPSAVHAARVAALRLRTALRVFRPWLDDERSSSVYIAVRGAGDILGRLRELDVVTQRLLAGLEMVPACGDATRETISAVLGARRGTARDDVLRMLESRDYRDLHDDLVQAVQEPLALAQAADTPAGEALPALVEGPWSRLERHVAELPASSPDSVTPSPDTTPWEVTSVPADEQWHQARLAAKRTRYAAEAVAPGVGDAARHFAESMAAVTDVLGEHHDAVVAEQFAATVAAAGETDAEVGYTLGTLAAGQRELAVAAAARFPQVWGTASRAELRRWFTAG